MSTEDICLHRYRLRNNYATVQRSTGKVEYSIEPFQQKENGGAKGVTEYAKHKYGDTLNLSHGVVEAPSLGVPASWFVQFSDLRTHYAKDSRSAWQCESSNWLPRLEYTG